MIPPSKPASTSTGAVTPKPDPVNPSSPDQSESSASPQSLTHPSENRPSTRTIYKQLIAALVIDAVIPLAIYYILKRFLQPVWALLIAGVPAALHVVFRWFYTHNFDVLGAVILAGFIFSAVLATLSGEPSLLLLRESVITGIKGVADLISLIPFRFGHRRLKPVMFYLSRSLFPSTPVTYRAALHSDPSILLSASVPHARNGDDDDDAMITDNWFDYAWSLFPRFRSDMRLLSLIWGVGLLLEFVGRLLMILLLHDIDKVVLFSTVAVALWLGILCLFSLWFGRLITKRVEEDEQRYRVFGTMRSVDEEQRGKPTGKTNSM
ncbi:hypothetical protein BC936DRAFT_140541 [Jimgerdemannia flammicorona]|uniref:Uncharacterized protein n=2 Tax=Jimgerdemannia flammicorona TaxID=994334 RepID=A0A433AP72_9FUNG|nr:hypothetical protein BC936DRAFT_140541 [Jimgerdemannia flammicorona]RUS29480.1 hypothetical protein BC938DRAFT_480619 [Jimgerdemannia flammicorona]